MWHFKSYSHISRAVNNEPTVIKFFTLCEVSRPNIALHFFFFFYKKQTFLGQFEMCNLQDNWRSFMTGLVFLQTEISWLVSNILVCDFKFHLRLTLNCQRNISLNLHWKMSPQLNVAYSNFKPALADPTVQTGSET